MQIHLRAGRSPAAEGRRTIGLGWAAIVALAAACHPADPAKHGFQGAHGSPSAEPTYLVVYRPGPGWLDGKPMAEQPLREHGRYLLALHASGALKLAGPFADESGGAAVFAAADDAAALALVRADPTIRDEVFHFDLRRWSLVDWAERAAASK